ncbi:MAG: Omp28-related outer membrane protein [Saprospiraceae bacterium]|nr:Omp28-related outer membrane protein [Saprospiraceae bacterium]
MKKRSAILLCLVMASLLSAQESAKKYLLIEHFTNSKCPPCASKNPVFYNLIGQAQYADDLHHISVHPIFPYPECVFYQANTSENTAWTNLYPISGTPTIVLNGTTQNPATPILTEAKLQTFLGQTSPLYVQVSESGPNNARTVNVKAKALGEIPAGNYKIFVAIAEKVVNQQTPNGETVHRNVFRKMLTAVAGDAFTVPSTGALNEYNFNYSIPNDWNANEVYVLAFVKEVDTKQVLNSGTRFDPVLSGTEEAEPTTIRISPNPASDFAWVALAEDVAQTVEVFASNGQRVSVSFENQGNAVSISTISLSPGIYFVKIDGEKGVYVGKFVRG